MPGLAVVYDDDDGVEWGGENADDVRWELEWGENVRWSVKQWQERQPCNDKAEDDDDDRVRGGVQPRLYVYQDEDNETN